MITRVSITALALTSLLAASASAQTNLVQSGDFTYLGSFRLPGGEDRPETFAYGGNAMTFRADGDPGGSADGCPGSLFVMGHDRLPYGELPNGNQIAEVSIPEPKKAKDPSALNSAEFIQPLQDAARGLFTAYDEIPRVGMEYVDRQPSGPHIYLAWGQHFHEDAEKQVATHAWIEPALTAPKPKGSWYVGDHSLYSVNGYLFEIPEAWAKGNVDGQFLATGRYRDGGWSGQGPALYAYMPWADDGGAAPPSNAHLKSTVLLEYESSRESEDVISKAMKGYQHCDEWEGGAWITTSKGKTAVLFAGTKGVGAKYWYGWVNPAGPEFPCIETEFVNQFTTCRLANGSPCPAEDLKGCEGHNDYRGWWSSRFAAQFILYSPDDLAAVARGERKPWQPQPYASIGIDDNLLLNPAHVEEGMIGAGVQRRFRIGSVAYDRAHDLLYVLEPFADGVKPVIHVWRIQ
ncbi:MAG: hypothetical protein K1Y02_06525 [Candidatus Hydrogenedentes bacterium]|nr:hypothetical protein [Candidatus Hydrogenedentota bacterium]